MTASLQPGEGSPREGLRLAELLGALSLATDLAHQLPAETGSARDRAPHRVEHPAARRLAAAFEHLQGSGEHGAHAIVLRSDKRLEGGERQPQELSVAPVRHAPRPPRVPLRKVSVW